MDDVSVYWFGGEAVCEECWEDLCRSDRLDTTDKRMKTLPKEQVEMVDCSGCGGDCWG